MRDNIFTLHLCIYMQILYTVDFSVLHVHVKIVVPSVVTKIVYLINYLLIYFTHT